jgi:hypothetical protein
MRVAGPIILDILDLIGRFFKFGMERNNSQVLISRVTESYFLQIAARL